MKNFKLSRTARNALVFLSLFLFIAVQLVGPVLAKQAAVEKETEGFVAVMDMNMAILPGTQAYLEKTLRDATAEGARLLIVRLDTPGGMLLSSQEMIQLILNAPIPVIVYVGPSGGTATSAGVFITLAGHVAAMSPGTTIGAAHPVSGSGEDIEGDMRSKIEQATIAMVKSIAEQRGRNVEWAEQSVKDSSSITEREALNQGVVDLVAEDISDLLKQVVGKEVKVRQEQIVLKDFSELQQRNYAISFQDKAVNVLANPNIAALLWLGATTGISLELYNPGTILPGVVGVICLVLALAVSQIIPISQGGVLLLVLGSVLIAAELYIASGILGVGGVISIVLGSLYLIDVSKAPELAVDMRLILPIALTIGVILMAAVHATVKAFSRRAETGNEGLIGMEGEAKENVAQSGKVFVNGELWNAVANRGIIEKGAKILVVAVREGMTLEVERVEEQKQDE